jgi:hypothetical protein
MNIREDCIQIKCFTEQEWIQIQEYAFSIGMEWPVGKTIQNMKGEYPKFLYLNYLDEYLCWSTDKSYEEDPLIIFHTTASMILRKSKLEKINGR